MAAGDVECVYKHALGVMRNLESQQENLQEQVRCAMVSSRLGQRPGWGTDNVMDWKKFDEPAPDRAAAAGETAEDQ
jgi:hypothetical protein